MSSGIANAVGIRKIEARVVQRRLLHVVHPFLEWTILIIDWLP
jgi:hypothetical protein